MLLIDDKELLIGSANLGGTSLTRNYEMAIWTDNPETNMEAKMYFTDLMGEIFRKKLNKKVKDD
jgi:phosphatidylserine/phosphatidylglycerophosphate/cardiolipin synthase-like enzyme